MGKSIERIRARKVVFAILRDKSFMIAAIITIAITLLTPIVLGWYGLIIIAGTIMLIALVVGQVVAYACKLVLREYLQQKKTRIDNEHFERIKTSSGVRLDEGTESEMTG